MPYAQIVDYNEAIQNPRTAFTDPELRDGKVAENSLGLPLVMSGGFALTYMVTTRAGKLAVRCFHREVPAAERKYAAISKAVKALNSGFFVDFAYQAGGIKVKGQACPIVRMDWVEGDTLGQFLDRNFDKPSVLEKVRLEFQRLAAYLESKGLAHGDIQNGNVMLSNGSLKLIDYDGMYVPSLPTGNGSETGHKHFQHPDRGVAAYGPLMDRFSFIAVDTSLQALVEDGSLYRKYREGGETIIFKANDFADPQNSEIFQCLLARPRLKMAAANFAAVCEARISDVPSLADFLAGKHIPKASAKMTPVPDARGKVKPPQRKGYIAPFAVVAGPDFAAAMKQVGNRVELIGKIVAVKHGVGKRGRGKGRPFVFINFGNWLGNIVKVTIWAEGLSKIMETPTEAWVGRWISVTALMTTPYSGKHYGRAYTHVGVEVTDAGQIQQISEAEARYRLASVGHVIASDPRQTESAGVPSAAITRSPNRDIIERLTRGRAGAHRGGGQRPTAAPGVPSRSGNRGVLDAIRAAQGNAASSPTTSGVGSHMTTASARTPYGKPSLLARIRAKVREWLR